MDDVSTHTRSHPVGESQRCRPQKQGTMKEEPTGRNDPSGTSKEEGQAINDSSRRRKKRLSRKEQKARKKKKAETPVATSKEAQHQHPRATGKGEDVSSNTTTITIGKGSDQITAQNDEQDYDANYRATPRPLGPHKSQKTQSTTTHPKSLGRWFPKAVVLKSLAPPSNDHQASIVLFYQYVNPLWPESFLSGFISYLCHIAEHRCLGGRIRVAREGVNATLSSRDTAQATAQQTLRHFARDLQGYSAVFQQTDFKYIDSLKGDRHFKDFKVFPVQELVFYGLPSDKTVGNADLGSMQGGVHLSAQEFHKKLTDPETVVVDVRNHYESMLGRFDGQQHVTSAKEEAKPQAAAPKAEVHNDEKEPTTTDDNDTDATAAEYIDPRMRKSTDWTRWLEQDDTKAKLEGKQVLLYCTGGIRCERASVYLNHKMGDKVKGIYQLHGGIERYFKAFPDGGHWRGKNFVFDKREAVDVHNPDGDGGVIVNHSNKAKTEATRLPDAKCCRCSQAWDRYVGKKKCNTCGVPVLVCDACLSHIGSHKMEETQLQCPLCVEEHVTVAAKDVEFTDNGMAGKTKRDIPGGTAAPSVLKWGGGHASQKKQERKFHRKPCRFGAACTRRDCFFFHPTGRDASQVAPR